jgi:hypothetical protein
MDARAVRVAPGGVRITVRLKSAAGRDRIEGIANGLGGDAALQVSVTAPPESGKANAALIGLLAKAWHLPKSAMRVASGARARTQDRGHRGRWAGAQGPH